MQSIKAGCRKVRFLAALRCVVLCFASWGLDNRVKTDGERKERSLCERSVYIYGVVDTDEERTSSSWL
jgi:hypothetical protein